MSGFKKLGRSHSCQCPTERLYQYLFLQAVVPANHKEDALLFSSTNGGNLLKITEEKVGSLREGLHERERA